MNEMMKLSKRLAQVVDLVSPCDRVADIGCDHGYVCIALIQQEKCKKAIAMDIHAGPIARAEENIRRFGLTDRIMTRQSDGFSALNPGEVHTVIIAGLGGELMVQILEQGKDVLDTVSELVLSPHSDWKGVRSYLLSHGFRIREERMLVDEQKYYVLMKVCHGMEEIPYDEWELAYGRLLLQGDAVLYEYLRKKYEKFRGILTQMPELTSKEQRKEQSRREQLVRELRWMEKQLRGYHCI